MRLNKWLRVCVFSLTGMILYGCAGTVVADAGVSASPTSLSFGSVAVGSSSAASTVVLTNHGKQSVTITQASSSLAQFVLSGPALPLTLQGGQNASFQVVFSPNAAGTLSANLLFTLNRTSGGQITVPLSGTGATAPAAATATTYLLSTSAASLSFGNVLVGSSTSQTVALSNTGNSAVSISQISATGAGFSASGIALPLTLAAGQSVSLTATFAPTATGTAAGSVSIVSNATNSPATVSLSGAGVQPQIAVTPGSISFGNVTTGASKSQAVSVSNPGSATLTITQSALTGAGFGLTGLTLPLNLAPGQSASFSVSFAPTVTGSVTGSLALTSNAPTSLTSDSLSGTGVQPKIAVTPGSISFGNVTTGTSNTQTVQLSNPGSATLTITQAALTGAGFGLSGLTLPLSLAPAQSASFTVSYSPSTAGSATGSLTLTSNAPTSPTAISLSGSGVTATLQLSASPTALNFGNVTVSSSATQSVTLSNTGNSSVSVSQLTVTGSSFSASGLTLPLTLAAGQSTSFSVTFSPASSGSYSGSAAVASNAANSPASVSLSGSGVLTHSVALSWVASTTTVAGYYVYRGSASGGPYTRLNASAVSLTSFTDSSVLSATTYYYVTTAVDSTGAESVNSNEVAAVIP